MTTPEDLDLLDQRLEKLLGYYVSVMDRGQRYTSFLTAAGFAAFFTIWGGFRPAIPTWATLITGSMMGVALILFVGFEIWKAQLLATQSARAAKALNAATPETIDRVIRDEDAISSRESLAMISVWPWVFYPSIVFGVGAATLLAIFGFLGAAKLI